MKLWMMGTLALCSAALAGGAQRTATTFQFAGSGCRPALGQITVGVQPDAAASRRMA
ncbi:hypothetical protein [Deinococcus koreensis]|uniref:hypothetical protein n=1 Tax=Deinococcus koreensis TaxID=2054903 RepID=UPI0013FE3AA4|nr:hypothetical protein [Deinococcus koreensis]